MDFVLTKERATPQISTSNVMSLACTSNVTLLGKGKGKGKAKAVALQACTGPEGSRKLRFPDFMPTAQDGGRLSALRTGRLFPRKYSWYSFLLEHESTPGP